MVHSTVGHTVALFGQVGGWVVQDKASFEAKKVVERSVVHTLKEVVEGFVLRKVVLVVEFVGTFAVRHRVVPLDWIATLADLLVVLVWVGPTGLLLPGDRLVVVRNIVESVGYEIW